MLLKYPNFWGDVPRRFLDWGTCPRPPSFGAHAVLLRYRRSEIFTRTRWRNIDTFPKALFISCKVNDIYDVSSIGHITARNNVCIMYVPRAWKLIRSAGSDCKTPQAHPAPTVSSDRQPKLSTFTINPECQTVKEWQCWTRPSNYRRYLIIYLYVYVYVYLGCVLHSSRLWIRDKEGYSEGPAVRQVDAASHLSQLARGDVHYASAAQLSNRKYSARILQWIDNRRRPVKIRL